MEKIYSNRIKELRKEKRVYQSELAKILSTGQSQVSNWETGLTEPNIEMLVKLAKFFNVSVDYIVGNEEF